MGKVVTQKQISKKLDQSIKEQGRLEARIKKDKEILDQDRLRLKKVERKHTDLIKKDSELRYYGEIKPSK